MKCDVIDSYAPCSMHQTIADAFPNSIAFNRHKRRRKKSISTVYSVDRFVVGNGAQKTYARIFGWLKVK